MFNCSQLSLKMYNLILKQFNVTKEPWKILNDLGIFHSQMLTKQNNVNKTYRSACVFQTAVNFINCKLQFHNN